MGKINDQVIKIAKPIVNTEGLKLVDVDYLKEGANWILRIFIENPEGELKLHHCENVSKLLSEELDQKDPIDNSYILEVSSPGLERPLKNPADFLENKGKLVKIKTFAPFNGKKEFTGELLNYENDEVTIEVDDKGEKGVIKIPFDKIANTHLAVDF